MKFLSYALSCLAALFICLGILTIAPVRAFGSLPPAAPKMGSLTDSIRGFFPDDENIIKQVEVAADTSQAQSAQTAADPEQPPENAKAASTSNKTSSAGASSSASTSSKTASNTAGTTKPASPSGDKGTAIINTAKQYIGVNYLWGGTTPSGFDCSGFTQYVFAKHGITLPRVSRDQFSMGKAVTWDQLKPGDLVFFSLAQNGIVDHVGIYTGNSQFINASSSKGVTIYTIGPYWNARFLGAKRVI